MAAILGTTAGLDAEKPAELHLVGIEVFAVDGLRLKQQIIERGFIKRESLLPRPIAADVAVQRRRRRFRLVRARYKRHIPSSARSGPQSGRSMQLCPIAGPAAIPTPRLRPFPHRARPNSP